MSHFSLLHRVFICRMYVLTEVQQFWNTLWAKLNNKRPYKTNIGAIHLKLQELQKTNLRAQEMRTIQLQEGWEDVNGILHYEVLSYMVEIVCSKLTNKHYDDPFAGNFGVDKTRELIGQKYYWPSLKKDVKSYMRGYYVCLASNAVRHKLYSDLQFLPVLTHWWKDLLIDFVTGLSISTN